MNKTYMNNERVLPQEKRELLKKYGVADLVETADYVMLGAGCVLYSYRYVMEKTVEELTAAFEEMTKWIPAETSDEL